jgi:drug/metabolite transporter (DMT)-like permease
MQAAVTLVCALALQTLVMLAWMAWRERGEIGRVLRAWKPSLFTGFAGASASFGWFMAMTLQQAALVKALGQVEMLFTFAASVLVFRERITRLEAAGCILIVLGIVMLVLVD